MDQSKSTPIFTLLPPFYDKPLYEDLNIYLKRIKEEFSIKVIKYKYLKEAFANDVFIINDEIVIRFPRSHKAIDHLQYEINLLKYLNDKLKITIPEYSYVSIDKTYAGYSLIPGKYITTTTFKTLSKINKEKVVNQLVDFINVFHKIIINDFEAFKPLKRGDFISIEEHIEKDLEEKLFPKLSKDDVDLIKNFYREAKETLKASFQDCPIHGDLYSYNVLWDKETSEVSVIDFSDYMISDPARDFEIFFDFGNEYAEMAYAKYSGNKDKYFLQRAEIYYKAHGIYTLLSSVLGAQISFNYAYKYFFKEKFK